MKGTQRRRGADLEGRCIQRSQVRWIRRPQSFAASGVRKDATPGGPAYVQHNGVNVSVERATRPHNRGQPARRSLPEFQTTGRSREDDDEDDSCWALATRPYADTPIRSAVLAP